MWVALVSVDVLFRVGLGLVAVGWQVWVLSWVGDVVRLKLVDVVREWSV